MHTGIHTCAKALLVAAMATVLAACGSLSKHIADDGSGAGELVWPSPDHTTPLHEGGSSPTVDSLRHIHAGMGKTQIAQLIGYPHFSEGVAWSVREWNYLFHFRHDGEDVQCQYKILFDKDKLARSFYWHPATCADLVDVAASAPAAPESFTLSTDALFAFDSAQLGAGGREALDELATKLDTRKDDIDSIRIVGYTDRLGSTMYNGLLSEQRAHAVMRYLHDHGIPGHLMTATGLGMDHPVKTGCRDDEDHDALVACLAPNRRVEVQVFGNGSR